MFVRHLARQRGYDVVELPDAALRRRLRLMQHFGVDLVLDVGARTGEYVQTLRLHGYNGRAVSFEPLASFFAELRYNAAMDPHWETVNCALGERDGLATVNVAGNGDSSSLYDMLPAHLAAAPHSAYVRTEQVEMRRLGSVLDEYRGNAACVYMKIDVQGAEREVLAGAEAVLPQIAGVQLEMSLVPLYDGQMLMRGLLDFMTRNDFTLMSIEPGFTDPKTGQLLQIDGVFFRERGN
jgi:FkbM family methyltransferase